MSDASEVYSAGYCNLNVDVVHVTHDSPYEMFWDWFKQTWIELQDVAYDPADSRCIDAARAVVNRQALPTPMEVLAFDVKITGLSRVALAQITRGRVGHCFNVESQMPQKLVHNSTIPLNIIEHPLFNERAVALQAMAAALYDDMYAAGIPPQDCRYITLHGQQTSLHWHVNYAALLGFFARRCENGLTDELNLVGRLLRRELTKRYLDDAGVERSPGSGWSDLIKKLDCMGSDKKMCFNVDRVFGNTGRFKAPASVPSITNEKNACDYDFSKSAFYLELQRMSDDVLFDGEREMIEDWSQVGFRGRLAKLESDS